ncbi:cupredoxin domain-containing protein [Streptomyces sp. NPDC057910]|uniref:cupredoxin domain-containing protein n=1 Tax=Streptomyces sp. NPDC057910 TaxID=3346278 RepID=UPI0036E6FF6A
MSRFPTRVALSAAVVLLAAAGCSSAATPSAPAAPTATTAHSAPSSKAPSPSAPTAAAARVTIDNFAFSPAKLTVHPGETVTVVNHDSATHTVTASTGSAFDTGPINPGKSATFKAPATVGAFAYVCSIHASMHGTLTVG